jgi:hypothetical protein
MANISEHFGKGGVNVVPGHGTPSIADALRDAADDFTELHTQFIALLVKLDVDFTAQNLAVLNSTLSEDYEATLTPAALLTAKV